jgi:hypothetical protein
MVSLSNLGRACRDHAPEREDDVIMVVPVVLALLVAKSTPQPQCDGSLINKTPRQIEIADYEPSAVSALAALPFGSAALTTDQRQVIQSTISAVKNMVAWNGTVAPVVVQMSISHGYALTTWLVGEGGGQAVLRKNSKTGVWSVLQVHGGAMDADLLRGFGVPANTASTLEAHLAPVPKTTP